MLPKPNYASILIPLFIAGSMALLIACGDGSESPDVPDPAAQPTVNSNALNVDPPQGTEADTMSVPVEPAGENNLSVIDYYNQMPDSMLHYPKTEIINNGSEWVQKNPPSEEDDGEEWTNLTVADIKNGYLSFNGDGPGVGDITLVEQFVVFKKADGSAVIGVNRFDYYEAETTMPVFYYYSDGSFERAKGQDVLPSVTQFDVFDAGKNLLKDQVEAVMRAKVVFELPRNGTEIEVGLMPLPQNMSDGKILESALGQAKFNLLPATRYGDLSLKWDRKKGWFYKD